MVFLFFYFIISSLSPPSHIQQYLDKLIEPQQPEIRSFPQQEANPSVTISLVDSNGIITTSQFFRQNRSRYGYNVFLNKSHQSSVEAKDWLAPLSALYVYLVTEQSQNKSDIGKPLSTPHLDALEQSEINTIFKHMLEKAYIYEKVRDELNKRRAAQNKENHTSNTMWMKEEFETMYNSITGRPRKTQTELDQIVQTVINQCREKPTRDTLLEQVQLNHPYSFTSVVAKDKQVEFMNWFLDNRIIFQLTAPIYLEKNRKKMLKAPEGKNLVKQVDRMCHPDKMIASDGTIDNIQSYLKPFFGLDRHLNDMLNDLRDGKDYHKDIRPAPVSTARKTVTLGEVTQIQTDIERLYKQYSEFHYLKSSEISCFKLDDQANCTIEWSFFDDRTLTENLEKLQGLSHDSIHPFQEFFQFLQHCRYPCKIVQGRSKEKKKVFRLTCQTSEEAQQYLNIIRLFLVDKILQKNIPWSQTKSPSDLSPHLQDKPQNVEGYTYDFYNIIEKIVPRHLHPVSPSPSPQFSPRPLVRVNLDTHSLDFTTKLLNNPPSHSSTNCLTTRLIHPQGILSTLPTLHKNVTPEGYSTLLWNVPVNSSSAETFHYDVLNFLNQQFNITYRPQQTSYWDPQKRQTVSGIQNVIFLENQKQVNQVTHCLQFLYMCMQFNIVPNWQNLANESLQSLITQSKQKLGPYYHFVDSLSPILGKLLSNVMRARISPEIPPANYKELFSRDNIDYSFKDGLFFHKHILAPGRYTSTLSLSLKSDNPDDSPLDKYSIVVLKEFLTSIGLKPLLSGNNDMITVLIDSTIEEPYLTCIDFMENLNLLIHAVKKGYCDLSIFSALQYNTLTKFQNYKLQTEPEKAQEAKEYFKAINFKLLQHFRFLDDIHLETRQLKQNLHIFASNSWKTVKDNSIFNTANQDLERYLGSSYPPIKLYHQKKKGGFIARVQLPVNPQLNHYQQKLFRSLCNDLFLTPTIRLYPLESNIGPLLSIGTVFKRDLPQICLILKLVCMAHNDEEKLKFLINQKDKPSALIPHAHCADHPLFFATANDLLTTPTYLEEDSFKLPLHTTDPEFDLRTRIKQSLLDIENSASAIILSIHGHYTTYSTDLSVGFLNRRSPSIQSFMNFFRQNIHSKHPVEDYFDTGCSFPEENLEELYKAVLLLHLFEVSEALGVTQIWDNFNQNSLQNAEFYLQHLQEEGEIQNIYKKQFYYLFEQVTEMTQTLTDNISQNDQDQPASFDDLPTLNEAINSPQIDNLHSQTIVSEPNKTIQKTPPLASKSKKNPLKKAQSFFKKRRKKSSVHPEPQLEKENDTSSNDSSQTNREEENTIDFNEEQTEDTQSLSSEEFPEEFILKASNQYLSKHQTYA